MSTQHCRTERARTAVEPREEGICLFQAKKGKSNVKMRQRVTRLLALSSALTLAGSLHAGTLLKPLGVSTDTDATNYYTYIDKDNRRDTQQKFRCFNGFNDGDALCDPAIYPGNSVNTIVTVKGHKNKSDLGSDVNGPGNVPPYASLGFWRRIELVVDKRSGHQGNVAMTTFNFTPGNCCDRAKAKSIVNMEYSPGPTGNRITKFYIYDTLGNRVNGTVFDPNLPAADTLYLPKGCASCHGGGKDYKGRGGSTGGGFFRLGIYCFRCCF